MLDKAIKSATNHNLSSEVVDTSVQEDEWIDEEIFEGYFLTIEELIQQEREIIEDEEKFIAEEYKEQGEYKKKKNQNLTFHVPKKYFKKIYFVFQIYSIN
jgi:hypothetical protein